jgi:fructose-1,6-bisphosphatase/sedoheptulose 1,7-bisphosphatase-like protein|tara:strand:- start:779 stop:1087 length:309 start_codon:yes stop_codon:yes gene_type:complete
MKFYRNAVYVLATLCFFNMLQSAYVYKKLVQIEQKEHKIDVRVPISEDLKELPLHSRLRDSQIMQAILMTHHQIGVHEPGSQPMCPSCQKAGLKTVTLESNN